MLTTSNAWGGVEVHTTALARALALRGQRVDLLQLGHTVYETSGRIAPEPGFTVSSVELPRPLDQLGAAYWRHLFRSRGLTTVVLAKGRLDVHWRSLDWAMWSGPQRFLCIEHAYPKPPVTPTSRRHLGGLVPGLGLWHYRYRALLALHRRALDRVIVVAGAIQRRLVEEYGYAPEQVSVVHTGVDSARFRANQAARASARARWGIPESGFVFGAVCRLSRIKRLDRMLRAFQALPGAHHSPRSYLVVVGSGPEETVLRTLAEQLGVAERCVWAGESPDPSRDYPGFDAFLLTSSSEGLPYSLLEAMASECVAVAMAVGGIPELLVDGVNGRLIAQDEAAFAAAMSEVRALPPEQRAAVGRAARSHVLEHHEEGKQTAALASLIAPEGDGKTAAERDTRSG